jgi:hypothetical protein
MAVRRENTGVIHRYCAGSQARGGFQLTFVNSNLFMAYLAVFFEKSPWGNTGLFEKW